MSFRTQALQPGESGKLPFQTSFPSGETTETETLRREVHRLGHDHRELGLRGVAVDGHRELGLQLGGIGDHLVVGMYERCIRSSQEAQG